MSISINCQCGRNILVSEELAGLPVRCPNCGRRHLVPVKIDEISDPEIIPEFDKPKTTPETKLCDNCNKVVPIKARFCPECGRFFGHFPKPPFHQKRPPQRPEIQPTKPEAFPGPFRGNNDIERPNRNFGPNPQFQPHRGNRHFRQDRCAHPQMPHEICEQVIKIEKSKAPRQVSGIAKFAFFSAFLGLLIMLIGVVIISSGGISHFPMHENNFKIGFGMMHVGGIFTFIAAITTFISMFHFHRKRFGLIFLTILFILATMMTSGAVMKSHKRNFFKHHGCMHPSQMQEIIKNTYNNEYSTKTVERVIFKLERELKHLTKDLQEKEADSARIIEKINEIETVITELHSYLNQEEQPNIQPIEPIEPIETYEDDIKPGSSDF